MRSTLSLSFIFTFFNVIFAFAVPQASLFSTSVLSQSLSKRSLLGGNGGGGLLGSVGDVASDVTGGTAPAADASSQDTASANDSQPKSSPPSDTKDDPNSKPSPSNPSSNNADAQPKSSEGGLGGLVGGVVGGVVGAVGNTAGSVVDSTEDTAKSVTDNSGSKPQSDDSNADDSKNPTPGQNGINVLGILTVGKADDGGLDVGVPVLHATAELGGSSALVQVDTPILSAKLGKDGLSAEVAGIATAEIGPNGVDVEAPLITASVGSKGLSLGLPVATVVANSGGITAALPIGTIGISSGGISAGLPAVTATIGSSGIGVGLPGTTVDVPLPLPPITKTTSATSGDATQPQGQPPASAPAPPAESTGEADPAAATSSDETVQSSTSVIALSSLSSAIDSTSAIIPSLPEPNRAAYTGPTSYLSDNPFAGGNSIAGKFLAPTLSGTGTTTPTAIPDPGSTSTSTNHTAVIIGAVLAVLLGLAICAFSIVFLRRRRRYSRHKKTLSFYRDKMVTQRGFRPSQLRAPIYGAIGKGWTRSRPQSQATTATTTTSSDTSTEKGNYAESTRSSGYLSASPDLDTVESACTASTEMDYGRLIPTTTLNRNNSQSSQSSNQTTSSTARGSMISTESSHTIVNVASIQAARRAFYSIPKIISTGSTTDTTIIYRPGDEDSIRTSVRSGKSVTSEETVRVTSL